MNYQYRNYLQDVFVKIQIADEDIDILSKTRTLLDQFDFSQSDFRDMMFDPCRKHGVCNGYAKIIH